MLRAFSCLITIGLAACSAAPTAQKGQSLDPAAIGSTAPDDPAPFSGIAADQTVRFTGTEPFWGGQVSFTSLTYSSPEDPEGTVITVERFAGRGGVSWSGTLNDAPFTLAVTPGRCNDGMSDRAYPFVATLSVKDEQRNGCAWTESDPFIAPPGTE